MLENAEYRGSERELGAAFLLLRVVSASAEPPGLTCSTGEMTVPVSQIYETRMH